MSDFLEAIKDPEEEKEEAVPSIFFDILSSISENKKDLSNHERFDKDYSQYGINSYFSRFVDTILQVNKLNHYSSIPKIAHYRYLLNTVKKKKRWDKDPKSNDDVLKMVSLYYGFSLAKAAIAMRLLSEEQLNIIKQKLRKGGTK